MGKEKVICLACVSSETHNLQRVFRPRGVLPLYRYVRRIQGKVCFFSRFGLRSIGYQFRPFWAETGYGLCTLVLNWVCFLEEATSSSFGDKTISPLMFTPTVYVP